MIYDRQPTILSYFPYSTPLSSENDSNEPLSKYAISKVFNDPLETIHSKNKYPVLWTKKNQKIQREKTLKLTEIENKYYKKEKRFISSYIKESKILEDPEYRFTVRHKVKVSTKNTKIWKFKRLISWNKVIHCEKHRLRLHIPFVVLPSKDSHCYQYPQCHCLSCLSIYYQELKKLRDMILDPSYPQYYSKFICSTYTVHLLDDSYFDSHYSIDKKIPELGLQAWVLHKNKISRDTKKWTLYDPKISDKKEYYLKTNIQNDKELKYWEEMRWFLEDIDTSVREKIEKTEVKKRKWITKANEMIRKRKRIKIEIEEEEEELEELVAD